MQKALLKILSLLLTIVLLVNLLPLSVFAAEYSEYQATKTTVKDVFVVDEIVDNRTEYSKDFRLSNGLNIKTVYSTPVHYEVDGQWQEIDNTLKSATTKAGSVYQNTAGIWQVSLPQSLTEDNGVTITKDGYTLNFRLSGELVDAPDQDIIELPVQPGDEFMAEASTSPTASETAPAEEETTAPEETKAPAEEVSAQAPEEVTIPAETVWEETTATMATEPTEEPTSAAEEPTESPAEETVPVETTPLETVPETTPPQDPVLSAVQTVVDSDVTLQAPSDTVSAKIEQIDFEEVKAAEDYPETVVEKLSSCLRYNDVYENTDVIFDLNSSSVKESIVMEEYDPDLQGYSYILNVGEMIPVLTADNEVELYDKTGKNIVMVMPAPFLVDQTGYINYDVEVSLTRIADDACLLTYELPRQWMASSDREWPIVLDPAVLASRTLTNLKDVTVYSERDTDTTRGVVSIGKYNDDGLTRAYLRFEQLPTLSNADVIVSATLRMYKPYGSSSRGKRSIELRNLTEAWSESTITWKNQPSWDPIIEDFVRSVNKGYYTWDATSMVRSWYEGTNYGMVLKFSGIDEAVTTATWQQFYSSEFGGNNYVPTLTIAYRNNSGIESYWDYTTTSAGRAGTGYVNQYSGNLTWVRTDMGFGGNIMPVSISHVYNTNDADKNEFGMGYGWRTNFNQRVYEWDSDDAATDYYIWEDGDGTKHYFQKYSYGVYKDEDGLEMTLRTTNSPVGEYNITDKGGNVSYFDEDGRLIQQTNNQKTKKSINITYNDGTGQNGYISQITDGVGRVYKFTYNASNLLSKIEYTGTGSTALYTVTYGYTGQNLTAVTDEDGAVSEYTYQTGNLLIIVEDNTDYAIWYGYTTSTPKRINSIYEVSGTIAGGELTFTYEGNRTKLTDHNGNVQILQFNNMGNTVSVQDDQGRAQHAKYAINGIAGEATDSTAKGNQLRLSSKLQDTVKNLLQDSSFENGTLWTAPSGITASIDSNTAYVGSKSMKLMRSENATGIIVTGPPMAVTRNEAYVFSAYVKAEEGASVCLSVQDYSGTDTSQTITGTGEWERVEVQYLNPTLVTGATATLQIRLSAGTCYIDAVQFEKSPTASRYNLVQNGDFTDDSAGWTDMSKPATPSLKVPAPQLDVYAYMLEGSYVEDNRLSQEIQISGEEGDTFVLAGWAWGDSMPASEEAENREFALIATFHHTDNTTSEGKAEFNSHLDSTLGWQYTAAPIVAEKDYDKITVEIAYDENANTMYFDGIQLFKEQFGSSYTYDDDGNVISVVNLQAQKTQYQYSNNNLTKAILPTGAELTYTYDNYHNVKTANTETGVSYAFEYDTYGNNTSVSIVDGTIKMKSTATYTSDGNRMVTNVDALGNVTTYEYNADTNVLEWVQYPNDTVATRTEYTYDEMFKLASTKAQISTGGTMSASYTYNSKDQLTAIITPTTTYGFAYGDFGLRENVTIGTTTLAEYTYTNRNNYLNKLTYGNDDSIQYTYDGQGRVISETYEDNEKITYLYNNNGVLATVIYKENGDITPRTTTYYYDFTERLMKLVVTDNSLTHSVGYEYDEINNLSKLVEKINQTCMETSYTYDDDNRITAISTAISSDTPNGVTNTVSREYTYDDFSRINTNITKHNGTEVFSDSYTFISPGSNQTSGQVGTYSVNVAGSNDIAYIYTYDDNGNILTVSDGTNTTSYVYDSANQLTRENNQAAGKTFVWTYDNAGNILNRKEYSYTTGTLGAVLDTVTYTYSTGAWGDLLTVYDNNEITYDKIGNPLSDGTWNYTWEHGRQLNSMTDGTTTWNYTYDEDGLRTSRSSGSTTYQYIYNGSSLTQMSINGSKISIAYDASGKPLAIDNNCVVYYYVTNTQGDVIALTDSSGNVVVTYTYDAWGNILSVSGTQASNIGQKNPLRYRGYVYDNESGFYYLQSRYYNPGLGRFLNADVFLATGQGMLGNNMFAYCNNNPVMYEDPGGKCAYCRGSWDTLNCRNYHDFEEDNGASQTGSFLEAINNHYINQNQVDTEIRLKQLKLIGNSVNAICSAYTQNYNLTIQNQQFETQLIIDYAVDRFSTPQKATNTTLVLGGLGELCIAILAAASVISGPAAGVAAAAVGVSTTIVCVYIDENAEEE